MLIQSLKSKTMWVSAATVVVAGIQYFAPVIPPQYTALAMAASGFLAGYIRTRTNQPLSEK